MPPTLVRPADRTVLEGESIHIPLQASDPNGDPLTYSSTMLPGGAYLDPNTGVFDWTPGYYQHGVYQVPFTVSNGQLSRTQTTTITVLNVNAPPQFDNLGDWRVYEGQDLSFRAFALDPNNPGFMPQDRTADGTLTPLDGTPADDHLHGQRPARKGRRSTRRRPSSTGRPATPTPGNYVVTFTATNDGDGTGVPLSSTVSVPITILNTNRAPQITFIANQTVNDGAVLTMPVQATDPDGDPLVLSAGGTTDLGLPSFATFIDNGDGTGTFTFAPTTDDAGNYTITLTATDNGDGGGPAAVLSTSQSFVVTVNNPNQPPHLAPIGDKVAVVGQPLQFTIHATDGDQDPLTFAALGLPGGRDAHPVFDLRRRRLHLDADRRRPRPIDGRLHGRRQRQRQSGRQSSPTSSRSTSSSGQSDQAPVLIPIADQTIAQQQTLIAAGPGHRPGRRSADSTRPPTCRSAPRSTRSRAC